jgi:soluble lytic murein transglycosylase-like protein
VTNPTPWAPNYRDVIPAAARKFALDPLVLLALAWQESAGGCRVLADGSWTWVPGLLYRYEPGFWSRYLAGLPEYAPPSSDPVAAEVHRRRVSASYGICQVMYSTARWHGFAGRPEELLDPALSAWYGAMHLRLKLDRPTDGAAVGDLGPALAAYNTGRSRAGATKYDDEVLAKVARLRSFAEAGGDPFA